jgi:hypothetical protein
MDDDLELIETAGTHEVFASGLGRIEILGGGVARLLLFAEHRDRDGSSWREVVLAVVMPVGAIGHIIELIMLAVGGGAGVLRLN